MSSVANARAEQMWHPMAPLSKSAGTAILMTWLGLTLLSLVWWMIDPRGLFIFGGFAACLILSLPLAVGRQYDLLSPWSLVLVGGYVGYAIRGACITLGFDGTRTIEQLYLLGYEPAYFDGASFLVLLGLLVFTLGYMFAVSAKAAPRAGRLLSSTDFDPRMVRAMVVLLAVVGFVAFYLYAQATGGLSLDRISGKRTVIGGLNLEDEYRSYGHLRFVNSVAAVAFWIQIAFYARKGLPHGIATPRGIWLTVLFLNACLLPFYASTRSDVIFVLITAVVIEFCLRPKTARLRSLVMPVVIGIGIVAILTGLRHADQDIENVGTAATVVDAFVLTHTFSDIPTTIHIMKAVPDTLPYANGETIGSWLAAPVPRSIWPDKPIISLGPTIGILIFGNTRAGIPPGLIAESYWNFGVGGLLLLPLVAGLGVGWGYRKLAPWAPRSPAAALLFSAVAIRAGIDLTTNSLGYALVQVAQGLAVLIPVLWIVSSPGGRGGRPPTGDTGRPVVSQRSSAI